MKILFLSSREPKDICNKNIATLINADYLANKGNEVFLVSYKDEIQFNGNFKHHGLTKRIRDPKNNIINIAGFIFSSNKYFIKGIMKIKEINPEIIICRGGGIYYVNFLMGIFFSKIFNIPIVVEWLGSDLLLENFKLGKKTKKIILRNTTTSIVQSDQMFKKAKRLHPKANVKILLGKGVNTDIFKPNKNEKRENKDNLKILFVGRLHKVKGLKYLLKSFTILNKKNTNIELILVGEGRLKEGLIELSKKKGIFEKVSFKGEINHEKLPRYYQNSDIFVLPSLSEGVPNVILEAMACGLPVVATKVGGNPELLEHGKGGYLIESKNPSQLAERIQRLINNPYLRKDMGEFNRQFVMKYDQEKILNKKERILTQIADQA